MFCVSCVLFHLIAISIILLFCYHECRQKRDRHLGRSDEIRSSSTFVSSPGGEGCIHTISNEQSFCSGSRGNIHPVARPFTGRRAGRGSSHFSRRMEREFGYTVEKNIIGPGRGHGRNIRREEPSIRSRQRLTRATQPPPYSICVGAAIQLPAAPDPTTESETEEQEA